MNRELVNTAAAEQHSGVPIKKEDGVQSITINTVM